MPISPETKKLLEQYGYKDLANFPEPSKMIDLGLGAEPWMGAVGGIAHGLANLSIRHSRDKQEEKNTEAMVEVNQAQKMQVIANLRGKGLDELADGLEANPLSDLPDATTIANAIQKKQELAQKAQEAQQSEQQMMSPIIAAQQAAQMKMPSDSTPLLSREFQDGFPSGPQSARPENLLAAAGGNKSDVPKAMQMGSDLATKYHGDISALMQGQNEPTPDEIADQKIKDVWDQYQAGKITEKEARDQSVKIKDILKGTSTMTPSEREVWRQTGIQERANAALKKLEDKTAENQANVIGGYYQTALNKYDSELQSYQTAQAKYDAMPAALKKIAGKPTKPTKPDYDSFIERYKTSHPKGYNYIKGRQGGQGASDEELLKKNVDDMSVEELGRFLELTK